MERRLFVRGSVASLAAFLYGCGGGGGASQVGLPIATSEADEADEGYRHAYGIEMLPARPALDTAQLLLPTPGVGFTVQVKLGAKAQAHVPVSIYDINQTLVDAGRTDSDGVFASQKAGHYFLFAVAQTPSGDLYGFEFNYGTKTDPIISVNLVPTLMYWVHEALKQDGKSSEFVIEKFFGISLATLLSDISVQGDGFDQDLIRQDFALSGLRLTAYLDGVVAAIMAEIEQGFAEELGRSPNLAGNSTATLAKTYAAASAGSLALKSSSACAAEAITYDGEFIFQDVKEPWIEPGDPLIEAVKKYWPVATKKLLEWGLGKAATAVPGAGSIISGGGSLILSAIFPPKNEVQEAFNGFYEKFQTILNDGIQKVITAINRVDFTSAHKEIKDYFDKFDTQIKNIRSRNADFKKIANPTALDRSQYDSKILDYSRNIIAIEDDLMRCHQLLFGVGAYGQVDSVLKKWFSYRSGKFHTSVVEQEYMAILDHFLQWMNLIHTQIVDAHATVAELTGQPRDEARIRILTRRSVDIARNIERVRPNYLPSERQIIDVEGKTTWLGRCNKIAPKALEAQLRWAMPEMRKASMRYTAPNEQCRPKNSPVATASILDGVIGAFNWEAPGKDEVEATFAKSIRTSAKANKTFNLQTFAANNNFPNSFLFMEEDPKSKGKKTKPVSFPMAGGHEIFSPFGGGSMGYELNIFQMDKLSVKKVGVHPWGADYHFFPMARLGNDQLNAYVPWLRFQDQYGQLVNLT